MSKEEYVIAIAIKEDQKIYDVSYFKGGKKECINFLNENYYKYLINIMIDKNKIVINLRYEIGDVDNLDKWKTKNELINEGALSL